MSQFNLASKVAFGAARCAIGVKDHEVSLMRAFRKGIRVVETSANYMGGNSEKLVGHVANSWRESAESEAEDITIISKFGYASAESKAPGLVPVAQGLSHSLHPDFFLREIKGSLDRLQGAPIAGYLVDHPEANLAAKLGLTGVSSGGGIDGAGTIEPTIVQPTKARLDDARSALYEEMVELFGAMEERAAVEGGFVYGVSCNGLSLPESEYLHVSWEKLVECARTAASRVGRERHSFRLIQMPGNLLEITGLSAAPAMRQAGLHVLIGDALKGATAEGRFDLLDDALRQGIPTDYMDVCRQVLEHFNLEIPDGREPTEEEEEIRQGCRMLQQLVQDMNSQLTKFTSLEHYEAHLAGHITPLLDSQFEALDETSTTMLQTFFERYGKMVRYSCAEKTRGMIVSGRGCPSGPHRVGETEPLQTYAVRWLIQQPGVSCAVVDMETAKQVDDAASA